MLLTSHLAFPRHKVKPFPLIQPNTTWWLDWTIAELFSNLRDHSALQFHPSPIPSNHGISVPASQLRPPESLLPPCPPNASFGAVLPTLLLSRCIFWCTKPPSSGGSLPPRRSWREEKQPQWVGTLPLQLFFSGKCIFKPL